MGEVREERKGGGDEVKKHIKEKGKKWISGRGDEVKKQKGKTK
jgi:hypothetical protein